MGQIIHREYVVFRDSDISCSLHGLSLLAMETAGETQRDGEPCFLVCSLCNWTQTRRDCLHSQKAGVTGCLPGGCFAL